MNATIKIELSPGSIALLNKFDTLPREIPEAIRRGMTRALEVVTGRIQETRLSGKGPFPVEEHRLGQVTQRLTRSTRASRVTITDTGENVATIEGAIGADVFYARIHEFGGSRAPERAPFRTGINENMDYISQEIEKELKTLLEGPSETA